MSKGLQTLSNIGTQRIHEQTHISKKHVQALLDETFNEINKIHFLGFISILEREYGVDLSDLKASAEEFYGDSTLKINEKSKVFVAPKKKKSYSIIYIAIVVVIFIAAVIFSINISSSASSRVKTHSIDNSAIEIAKETIANNATKENNITIENTIIKEVNSTNTTVAEPLEVVKSFKIIPNVRLWLGYIDIAAHKKYQKTRKDEIILDPQKEWLLIFGHNNVKVEIDGEKVKFKGRQNIRLLYKDSKLSNITIKEFKKLNRGKKW